MAKIEVKLEMNLRKLILELREVSQAFNECADKLVMIDIKYNTEQESEDKENKDATN